MADTSPELFARKAVERCAHCGYCRDYLADSSCLLFRRLYRLIDREKAGRGAMTDSEIKRLVDLCNLCGICPCVEIRTWIRQAKDGFVERTGLPPTIRVLEDVGLLAKLGGAFPRTTNFLLKDGPVGRGLRRLAGIHPERKLPRFPVQAFDVWARERGLHREPQTSGRKVAYFTGCTARYLFPEVAKATVEVLEKNGIAVYMPPQKCCGMPSLLEGDRAFTHKTAGYNLGELTAVVEAGYDIVCSCPTCSYFLKGVQPAEALYSPEFRARVLAISDEEGGDLGKIAQRLQAEEPAFQGRPDPSYALALKPTVLKLIHSGLLRDRGYLAAFDGLQRLRIASRTYDLGEYLRQLDRAGRFNRKLGPVPPIMAYYPPCHQREQDIGQPWLDVLAHVPGVRLGRVGDLLDCCGLGGIMGFKKSFHATSLSIGRRLRDKVKAAEPETLLTDCLSCRMQFQQMLPLPVAHPVEILRDAYRSWVPQGESDDAGHD